MVDSARLEPAQPLGRDGVLLIAARFVRMFAYGSLGVVFGLYLSSINFDEGKTGLLSSLTLLGGTIVLESEEGRGSTFRVWLPRAAPRSVPRM